MQSTQKKFVVVGAGQIGSIIARRLAARGDSVVVVSRRPRVIAGVQHVARDVAIDDIDDVCAGADAVFVAVNVAYDHKLWAKSLPLLNRRSADAAARAGAKLVVLENLYVYGVGNADRPLREDMALSPSSKKGAVRAQIAHELFTRGDGLRVASVRPPDFYGPGLTSALLDDKAVKGVVDGSAPFAVGDADAVHARAYVDDVAAAMVALADEGDDSDVWGRAWHTPVVQVSTRDLVAAIARAAGVADPGVRVVPRWAFSALALVVPMLREIREMLYLWDRPHLVDDSAFRARFPQLRATSLDDAARACVAAVTQQKQAA